MILLRHLERLTRAPLELPVFTDSSHILLASFPKSGNTWLRFMLANMSRLLGRWELEVDFHTVARYVPEIRRNRTLENRIETPGFPLFLKTHFPWIRGFREYRSVVVVRDPADTLVSYYRHLGEGAGRRMPPLDRFIRHWRYGAPAWKDWYGSWRPYCTHIIRYETLLTDPAFTLRSLFEGLELNVPDETIAEAISLSSRENMRRLQAERGDPNLRNPSFQFVNRARAGAGRETLGDAELRYVRQTTDTVAKWYGYGKEGGAALR